MDFQHNFIEACKVGDLDKVKLLLIDDRVINFFKIADINNYAIQWASLKGHFNVVKLLLEDKRINPAYDNNLGIKCASHNGHFNVVKLLLEDKRINPADTNNCAIRWASKNGHFNVIKRQLCCQRNNRVINSFNIDNINYIKKYCSKKIRQLVVVLQKLF